MAKYCQNIVDDAYGFLDRLRYGFILSKPTIVLHLDQREAVYSLRLPDQCQQMKQEASNRRERVNLKSPPFGLCCIESVVLPFMVLQPLNIQFLFFLSKY